MCTKLIRFILKIKCVHKQSPTYVGGSWATTTTITAAATSTTTTTTTTTTATTVT
jgi:hypothetical protein